MGLRTSWDAEANINAHFIFGQKKRNVSQSENKSLPGNYSPVDAKR